MELLGMFLQNAYFGVLFTYVFGGVWLLNTLINSFADGDDND